MRLTDEQTRKMEGGEIMKDKTEERLLKEESSGEFLARIGIDGYLWAKEFMKLFGDKKQKIDEELMVGWFCNSIMAGYDYSHRVIKKEDLK